VDASSGADTWAKSCPESGHTAERLQAVRRDTDWIISESGHIRRIVQDHGFVIRSDGGWLDVQEQPLNDARPVALGNRHLILLALSD
jgi:hypothetical protein